MAYIFWAYFYAGSILSRAYLRLSQYTANIVFRSNCITGEIMLAKLPQSVVNYLAAVKAQDTGMFPRCCAEEARVHDDGPAYHVLEAMTRWMTATPPTCRHVSVPPAASATR